MAVKANLSWDALGPLLVWQFLIPMAAGWAQSILYTIFIRAGDPKPQRGSPRYIRHRRQILMAIYVAYFAFIIYEVDFNLQRQGTAYSDLGVPLDVSESALASRFRKLAVRFHPDKVKGIMDSERAHQEYVRLQHARDIIQDPVKRFAYDRFGSDIIRECSRCLTVREYVNHALMATLVTYGALMGFLLGANQLGYLRDGAYWRYLAILALATYEVRTGMRPDHPPFLTSYINPFLAAIGARPPYAPFQITTIVRKAALSAAQCLGLLIPLWRDDPRNPVKSSEDTEEARHKQLDRLEMVVRSGSQLATRLVEMESTPYRGNERAKNDLKEAMKRYMMTNAVHMDRDVRNAIGQSYARRRAGVPSGARGTH